jgi:uncharacterized protein YggT (Ycf19 family)
MAFALVLVKTLVEIAALALLGQFLVGAFAWSRRQQNPIYRLFQLVASPVTRLVRLVTPKLVLDQHIPLAAFFVLVFTWMATVYGLTRSCAAEPEQAACARLAQSR